MLQKQRFEDKLVGSGFSFLLRDVDEDGRNGLVDESKTSEKANKVMGQCATPWSCD
ncbi:hypothetical protein COLO4_00999 [Corchorus olitorius]|uniref:Uncharacterized protein n=1 Tax=Corchorus olitorius TaxID=93759 RepID=A0A1R3L326_9ROSI|nr:hypothetical protein COLO4_00999 [Corchorus olitorius]